MRQVAVTGVGVLTALGAGRTDTWNALLEGRSGVRRIQHYAPESFRTRYGAIRGGDFEGPSG